MLGASIMDAASLHQFIRILAVALGALVAAPIVVYIAEASERHETRRERRLRQRRISTQQPIMQF